MIVSGVQMNFLPGYPRHQFKLVKSFKVLSLSSKLANIILATLFSLHSNIYKIERYKLPQLAKMEKISAEEYFMCVGYVLFCLFFR